MALIKLNQKSLPSGSVLQVQYTQFTGTASPTITVNTDTALTDLTVSITPTSASSKILLQTHVFFEGNNSNDHDYVWMFFRDATVLKAPVAGSRRSSISAGTTIYYETNYNSTPSTAVYQYFDTPASTSALTYKVGVQNSGLTSTLYINRSAFDTDAVNYERGISYISATEIAG